MAKYLSLVAFLLVSLGLARAEEVDPDSVYFGEPVKFTMYLHNATGELATADATPTVTIKCNNVADASITVTMVLVDTGEYSISFDVPGLGTTTATGLWDAKDWLTICKQATVDGIEAAAIVFNGRPRFR